MEKWEFCYICRHSQRGYEDIFLINENGSSEKLYSEKDATLENAVLLLNKLGGQGWELVGATASSSEHGWTMRRPKAGN